MAKKPEEMIQTFRKWPVRMNKKLHMVAVAQGRSMRSIVVEAVEQWLKRSSKRKVS